VGAGGSVGIAHEMRAAAGKRSASKSLDGHGDPISTHPTARGDPEWWDRAATSVGHSRHSATATHPGARPGVNPADRLTGERSGDRVRGRATQAKSDRKATANFISVEHRVTI
jgi:hypothetical protein